MRIRLYIELVVLVCASLALVSPGSGGEKTSSKPTVIEGRLTKDDPLDKVRDKSYAKTHPVKLTAGTYYKMQVSGRGVSPMLRLETRDATPLVLTEPGENGAAAYFVYQPRFTGTYHVIVTTAEAKQTGAYTLKVEAPSATEILFYRVKRLEDLSAQEQKDVAADYVRYLAGKRGKVDQQDLAIAYEVGERVEELSAVAAGQTYQGLAKALSSADDPKVAKVARMFAGAARRVNLPGNQLELKASTLDGKRLDWKSYRGKIVLVDFWATWCGPCVGELPNVRKMYDTYHKQGFEVIGISLDYTKDKLKSFLDREKLPWVTVFDDEPGNGLAEYYGVFGIPLPILVDREGRVLSLNARGRDLEQLLEKHLGQKE